MKLKIVFFGTPLFAAEILQYLLEHHADVRAVVTQPDRPKGRSLGVAPTPVKEVLLRCPSHIPIFQPEKASEESFLSELAKLKADLFVVVAYGQILTQKLLDIPPLGCINIHASLLPKYRGAAPIQRCLMEGEEETGIAIQKMVRQLDAGDVIAVNRMKIPLEMTFGELEKKLCDLSKPMILSVLKTYEQGIPAGVGQDHGLVTYASKIELNEGEIDWSKPALQIHNLIRAFSPKPGAWVYIGTNEGKKRLKVLRSEVVLRRGRPGELLSLDGVVGCGRDAIKLLEVQPEGKKVMSAADWLRGYLTPSRGQKNHLLFEG